MSRFFFLLLALACAVTVRGQSSSPQVELANMREDLRGLMQKVSELSLRLEELDRENRELRSKAVAAQTNFATLSQLNAAVTDMNLSLKAAIASAKSDTLQQVGAQMEKLAKQTNEALDSLAKGMATRAPVQTTFSKDFPQGGISYTVQQGDNLATIARKTGAKQEDIVNANEIADRNRIPAGRTLFIPGGKAP